MPDSVTKADPSAPATPQAVAARFELKRRLPTTQDIRAHAKKRLPHFAFEYMDGGAGADGGIKRNWSAFDAIEMVPRYGNIIAPPPADTRLFGRPYTAPLGIAPIGSPGTGFPGAERYFAAAAQAARVPYIMGVLGGISIEEGAAIAPDVMWLQIYRFHRDGHRIGFDIVQRAEAAGVHVLVLTIDTPIRTTRSREVKVGITNPFRLTMKIRLEALSSPHWLGALMKNGVPKFVSIAPYMGGKSSIDDAAQFMQRESGGAFTWDEIARYRDKWKKPLVLKGVLHPDDAARAQALGLDGIIVSNHGGRQIEALPASIDVLPAIASEVGGKLSIMLDSGVRGGVDAARAIALGADAVFAGKAFLWSLGALGADGPGHLIALWTEEVSATLGQLGCANVSELRSVHVRHPGAWTAADFAPRN